MTAQEEALLYFGMMYYRLSRQAAEQKSPGEIVFEVRPASWPEHRVGYATALFSATERMWTGLECGDVIIDLRPYQLKF